MEHDIAAVHGDDLDHRGLRSRRLELRSMTTRSAGQDGTVTECG